MIPKEKAIELVGRFSDYTVFRNDCGHDEEVSHDHAKQCALICAEEFIKYHSEINLHYEDWHSVRCWQEVKEEIEKL